MSKYKINSIIRFLINAILFIFTKVFRVQANISKDIKDIKEPYLLLGNHIGTYDPFIISLFIKKPAHFVSSDAVFRDPLIGFLFKRLGVIPKQKNARDTQVIRDMLAVSKAGGAIGLFPEGTRSWTGTTLPFDPVIAKLIKLLNITVITARMKGMQLSHPRWGSKLRRSKVEIDYQIAISKEDIKTLSLDKILTIVKESLAHDEVDYQREKLHIIHSKHRAEHIEYVLFLCSKCNSLGQLKSKGNDLLCQQCQQNIYINPYGFFEVNNTNSLPFDNIRDAYLWQQQAFEAFIEQHFHNQTQEVIFDDTSLLIYLEIEENMVLQGEATASFFIDHILLEFDNGKQLSFYLDDIDMINPQFHEKIEVNYKGKNYQLVGKNPGISGIKWEIATSVIWKLTGQEKKLSLYLTNE